MAKKKKSIDLSEQDIRFSIEEQEYRAVRFYPSNMSVDVIQFQEGKKQGLHNLPFAHLPKKIKQIIKPKR